MEACRAVLTGPPSDSVILAVHGKYSHQADADIQTLMDVAVPRGHQVLTFDLPGHGSRPGSPDELRISDAAGEVAGMWAWAGEHFPRRRCFATSLGAYLSLVSIPADSLEEAWLLSPVTDMGALVRGLMSMFDITEDDLRQQQTITTPVETLDWTQYRFIAEHPVGGWATPIRILRGAHDDLVPPGSIEAFCERTGATLTVAPDSGHYFHTESDLAQLRSWLKQVVPVEARALDQAGE